MRTRNQIRNASTTPEIIDRTKDTQSREDTDDNGQVDNINSTSNNSIKSQSSQPPPTRSSRVSIKEINNCAPANSAPKDAQFVRKVIDIPSTNEPKRLKRNEKTYNVLIGATGSVATIKLAELTQKIKSLFPRPCISRFDGSTVDVSVNIRIVMTKNSQHFVSKNELIRKLQDATIEVFDDDDEWRQWSKMGDPVLHIDLRKWANLFLIAPLDANTLAKMANGICDNLLTCIVRAWDISKPLVYCPAMNVHMYNHPITRDQLCKLQSFSYLRVDSVEKRLACGDYGIGGMAAVETIADKVVNCLLEPIVKKPSLTKPLLNQQPTYPIISSCNGQATPSHSKNPSSSSPRITIRALPTKTINNNQTEKPNEPSSSFLVKSKESNKTRQPHSRLNSGPSSNIFSHPINLNGRLQPNRVTSLQNLEAISLDCPDPLDTDTNSLDDDPLYDIDPSGLLEQSMITDETSTVELEPSLPQMTTPPTGRTVPFASNGLSSYGLSKPMINTSKLLSMCHDESRGCFTCKFCFNDYKNRKSMARHLKEQHVQGSIYHCAPCGVSYKRREKLIKHNRERHPHLCE